MNGIDNEAFCRCGHDLAGHDSSGDQRCVATEPDRCSCHGYRPGARSTYSRPTRHRAAA